MARFAINKSLLWDHQNNGLVALSVYPWVQDDGSRRAGLLYFGTGSGKTALAIVYAFTTASNENKPVLIVAPGKKTAERYAQEWPRLRGTVVLGKELPEKLPILRAGAAKADLTVALAKSPVVIATVKYMINRIRDAKWHNGVKRWTDSLATLIIDEGHHIAAGTWREIVDGIPGANVLYLTGTPVRHDKELLPLVPYEAVPLKNGAQEYKLLDVAEMTGVMAARYTLADAVAGHVVKRVSPETGMAPVDAKDVEGGGFSGESLDEFKRNVAKDPSARVNVFDQPIVIQETLKLALGKFRQLSRDFRIGRKLSAICKARNVAHARLVASIANKVGWSAVVFYSTERDSDEESFSDDVAGNLSAFESERSDVNLCVQVNALTEGYDNAAICMCIWLCSVESNVTRDQFNGRGLRLYGLHDDKEANQLAHPPLVLVFPNVQPLTQMMNDYVNMANDMSFVIKPEKDGGGGGEASGNWVEIEKGDFFMLGLEKEWQEAKRKTDPVTRAADAVFGGVDVSPDVRAHVEEQIRAGKLFVPGFDVAGTEEIASSPDDVKAQVKRRMQQISFFIRDNGVDARRGRSDADWKALVAQSSNCARIDMWPGTKGLFSNPNIDMKQLAEFLAADISKIQLYALRKLRDFSARGLCRNGS